MIKFWSEVPAARTREVAADVATWMWVALWTVVTARLYETLVGFAEAGRALRRGGASLEMAGVDLGRSLEGVPLVGEQASALARAAFGTAGEPFIYVGEQLEQLLLIIAALLCLLVLGVTLIPWLTRYVPWRARRLGHLRAAHRAIRIAPRDVPDTTIQRELASRALYRLPYAELLAHSPDPFGDFARGRYDRLARAELESVGLRP